MKMDGEYTIDASKKVVWQHLNSAETLQAAISGCKQFDRSAADAFTAKIEQKIGPIKYSFDVEIFLRDVVADESYRIEGSGKGGIAGFAKGGADVKLDDAGGSTKLSYKADAVIRGKIASLGSRVIDSYAKKLAREFFEKFAKLVEGAA